MAHANFSETTLAAALETVDGVTLTVAASTSFPATPFIAFIDTECFNVTDVTGVTWTVTRGYESSTAATHLNAAKVIHEWSAGEANTTVHTSDASVTDEEIAVFDGTTGAIIQGGVITATPAELNIMDGVTSTYAELNKLDGIDTTAAELGYVHDVTSAIQTQLNGKADVFIAVAQNGHGLTVGNAIYCTGANTYAKALADAAATSDVVGVVSVDVGTDDFIYCASGKMTTGVPAVAAGSVLFLSDATAGLLTTTEPTAAGHVSLPIAIVLENAVSMIVYSWRGIEIGASASSADIDALVLGVF